MIHTETDPQGLRLVVKTATGNDADRLRHEAEILSAVDHPGVVELMDLVDDVDRVRLTTGWIDGANLAEDPPESLGEVARTMAAVARILADLHESGIVHGDVSADHVLVDPVGRVTLCGFSRALFLSERPDVEDLTGGPTEADDQPPDGSGVRWPGPEVDLAATGALILELVSSVPHGGSADSGIEPEDLQHLGELACESAAALSSGLDFTMADLADRLAHLCPQAHPGPPSTRRTTSPGGLNPLRPAGILATVALGALLLLAATTGPSAMPDSLPVGASAAKGPDAALPTRSITAAPVPTAPSSTVVTTTDLPELVAPAVAPCTSPIPAMHLADIDGDGCPEGWYRTSDVLVADGIRYSIGDRDDLITVGDWNCDGVATPALVTVPEGQVFLFPVWEGDAGSVTAPQLRVWPDPRSLQVRSGPTCDSLVVLAASGRHEIGGDS